MHCVHTMCSHWLSRAKDVEGEALEAKARIQALDREINGIEGRYCRGLGPGGGEYC